MKDGLSAKNDDTGKSMKSSINKGISDAEDMVVCHPEVQ